jgi:glycosyltransferase involved in cell wall biosynthesis
MSAEGGVSLLSAAAASPQGPAPVIAEGLFSFALGGSERVGADVAIECARRGYRVVAFAFYGSGGPIRDELESNGIECTDLNYQTRTPIVRRLTYHYELYSYLRKRDVRAIHIHHCTSLILGAIAARLARVPKIVMTEHSLMELRTMASYRRRARRYCKLADAVTLVHPALELFFLENLAVPREKLHYVPNGVRLQRQDRAQAESARRSLGIDGGDFLWMFAGRLAAVKGLDTLLRAFALAAVDAPYLKLVLVGDGAERTALETLAKSLGLLQSVQFLGPRMDVPHLLRAADAFVMSSLSEGLPMVLLEAMAAHVPCVATAVGGIPELLDGEAGLLVQPGAPEELAAALRLMTNDPELRRRISARGFAKVAAANDLNQVVDTYLGLFGLPARWP